MDSFKDEVPHFALAFSDKELHFVFVSGCFQLDVIYILLLETILLFCCIIFTPVIMKINNQCAEW